MLYNVQSMRYVKLANRAVYDRVVAYMAMYDHLSHGNKKRAQEADQSVPCDGDKLLKPLAWYSRTVKCVDSVDMR
jgi:hypothetical protein